MANRYWYGLHWLYGVGTRWAEDNTPTATVMVFLSKRERDAWVDADRFDGNYHRSVASRGEALPLMAGTLRDLRSIDSRGVAGWNVDGRFFTRLSDAYAYFQAGEQAMLDAIEGAEHETAQQILDSFNARCEDDRHV